MPVAQLFMSYGSAVTARLVCPILNRVVGSSPARGHSDTLFSLTVASEFNAWGSPTIVYHPTQMATETGISSGLKSHLAHMQTFYLLGHTGPHLATFTYSYKKI